MSQTDAEPRAAAPPSPAPPLFLVAAQRSGTTLLRLMLDHHPQIAFPHEFDFAVAPVGDDGALPPAAALRARLQEDGSFRRSGLQLDPSLDSRALLESLLEQHRGGKPRLGMTVHGHFERLLALWPEARFIHLVRDPRAVARSVVDRGWAGNVWVGVERWIRAEQSWDRLAGRIPEGRWTEVRYEALVGDPERELRRLCAFIGVDWDRAMLEYARATTFDAPDPRAADRWRHALGTREQRLVEGRVGALLAARGYAPSGRTALRPGPLGRTALRLHSWWGRLRYRIRLHGLPLLVLDVVGRRLRIEPLRRHAHERILVNMQKRVQ